MKKILFLILCIVMILSVCMTASCQKPADESGDSSAKAPVKPDLYGPLTLYVSTTGSADGNGSQEKPFANLTQARDYIRLIDKSWYSSITVLVQEGTYSVKNSALVLDTVDSGTASCPITYMADGHVILNGGVTLNPADFDGVTDTAVLTRLSNEVQSHVVCLDLSSYDITADDYGVIHALGVYLTEQYYSDVSYDGPSTCQIYYNGQLMNLARYPNEGWLGTGNVVRNGEHVQNQNGHFVKDGNPEAEIYQVDENLADRIASWATLDDVWMYGYWKYDWALSSTEIADFNVETRELTPKYSSWYGAEKGKPYYFFNILEELDAPGEWYLDRENGILYLYADDDFNTAVIDIVLSRSNVVQMNGCSYVTIDGFEMEGSLTTLVSGNATDYVTIQNCLLHNSPATAISVTESTNLTIYNNSIENIGEVGINVSGGVMETLTASDNLIDNNLIHDYSQVSLSQAICVTGVGNTVSHNEIYNAPHQGITFSGPLNTIEYNEIYNVCLEAYDAGAIYIGRTWNSYGSKIQYNYIHDMGTEEGGENNNPVGIYIDDAASGITVLGNLLVNNWGYDIQVGGGRDMVIESNFIVTTQVLDAGKNWYAIEYDQRGYDGLMGTYQWGFEHTTHGGVDCLWDQLALYNNSVWQEAFPNRAAIQDYTVSADGSIQNVDGNKYNGCNPGCGVIRHNVLVANRFSSNAKNVIASLVYEYNEWEDFIYCNDMTVFKDAENGDFKVKKTKSCFETHDDMVFYDFALMGRQSNTN